MSGDVFFVNQERITALSKTIIDFRHNSDDFMSSAIGMSVFAHLEIFIFQSWIIPRQWAWTVPR